MPHITPEQFEANSRKKTAADIAACAGDQKKLVALLFARRRLAEVYAEDGARATADLIARVDIALIEEAMGASTGDLHDATRFARASEIIEGTTAVRSNELELDTEKPTPRYLIEERSDGRYVWYMQASTFEDAAEMIDSSVTEDVDTHIVYDLDTGLRYEADSRTVAFNLYDDEPYEFEKASQPAHSTGVPRYDVAHDLTTELDTGDKATHALAEHLLTMGAAELTQTITTEHGTVLITAKVVR